MAGAVRARLPVNTEQGIHIPTLTKEYRTQAIHWHTHMHALDTCLVHNCLLNENEGMKKNIATAEKINEISYRNTFRFSHEKSLFFFFFPTILHAASDELTAANLRDALMICDRHSSYFLGSRSRSRHFNAGSELINKYHSVAESWLVNIMHNSEQRGMGERVNRQRPPPPWDPCHTSPSLESPYQCPIAAVLF